MIVSAVRTWRAFRFNELPSFSQPQAAAWNGLVRAFSGDLSWRSWIAEGLTDFFEMPGGFEMRLRQRHTMDTQQPEAIFTFDASEVTLGRDETCDVRLIPRSIGKSHARIFTRAGKCYLEDLGSALGTFLNESRIAANRPVPITTGDQFAIFPYTFALEVSEKWVRSADVDTYAGPASPMKWEAFCASAGRDRLSFAVYLQPVRAMVNLDVDRHFQQELTARLVAPLGTSTAARLNLTSADTGFFEVLLAAVLERINRDLQFPLKAALSVKDAAIDADETGLTCSFAVRVADLTGSCRLFLSDTSARTLAAISPKRATMVHSKTSWAFPVSAGYVDLTIDEVASINPADVVLLTPESSILFPNTVDRGWRLLRDEGNFSRATIDNYFERPTVSRRKDEPKLVTNNGTSPDLAGLPIRIHAIVGEKEMTLAEANQLVAGAIVELDRTKDDPVRIALNGKIAGAGELVEVDGRLGIRILAWRAP